MSKDNVFSASAGATLSLLSINAAVISNAAQVFMFGLIGGVGGIVGKLLVNYIVKKWKERHSGSK